MGRKKEESWAGSSVDQSAERRDLTMADSSVLMSVAQMALKTVGSLVARMASR
jgi:hypothetical protein